MNNNSSSKLSIVSKDRIVEAQEKYEESYSESSKNEHSPKYFQKPKNLIGEKSK